MQAKNKKINTTVLFDSSAVIAMLKKEHGFELLDDVLANSSISTVNLSEIVSVLTRSGVSMEEIDKIIDGLIPRIIPFSYEIAILAGKMIIHTQKFGLSFGDRACIATGIKYQLPVYTTDQAWQNLQLESLNIILIR